MWKKIKYNRIYERVIKQGKKFYGEYVNLYYLPDQEAQKELMIGIVAGKKVGKAVRRNKVKRWIREYFNLYYKDSCNLGGYLVLIAQKPCSTASWKEVKEDISSLLGKIKSRIGQELKI